ncbi:MAG: hypothetical protein ACLP9C_02140 [Acidimicrobiales bacterium]
MTKPAGVARCAYCHRPLVVAGRPGRPARYCKRSHRQRAYEARRRAQRSGLADGLVIVAQAELDRLHDRLYALEAALEDVDSDLAQDRSAVAVWEAFEHLYGVADRLRGLSVELVTR